MYFIKITLAAVLDRLSILYESYLTRLRQQVWKQTDSKGTVISIQVAFKGMDWGTGEKGRV